MCSQTKLTTTLPAERIFAYIVQFKRAHDGLSPSVFQIAQECHLAASAVQTALTELAKANRIKVMVEGIVVIGGIWSPPTAPPQSAEDLSPVAFAITAVDKNMVGSQPKSLRWWAGFTGYAAHRHVQSGFEELVKKGLAKTVPYGKGRKRYIVDFTGAHIGNRALA